jgi:4,5-DOPA dioxygenase extradiol
MGTMNTSSPLMPVLFIGHGSPMNAIADNDFTRALRKLGGELPRPRSIMVVSAHWHTKSPLVNSAKNPEQIYDFFGFPPELYAVKYPCPGAPDDAQLVARTTKYLVNGTSEWGIDHAAWAVLAHLYPEADVPVFEIGIDPLMDPRSHYELGRRLASLRRSGILVIGSGNMVHNLRMMEYDTEAEPHDWAVEIDRKLASLILSGDHGTLISYREMGRNMSLAAPESDHFIPMLYALALQEDTDRVTFFHEGIQNGTVSMRSFVIG